MFSRAGPWEPDGRSCAGSSCSSCSSAGTWSRRSRARLEEQSRPGCVPARHLQRVEAGQLRMEPYERARVEASLARIEALAKLMDSAFVLPGSNVRVGLDAILGLVTV